MPDKMPKSALPPALAPLVNLLVSGFVPKPLAEIVAAALSGRDESFQQTVLLALNRKLDSQITIATGNAMAHAITKQIDAVIDDPTQPGVSQAEKNAIGEALATQAAHVLAEAGAALLAYPPYQEAVVAAKENAPGQLTAARANRDIAQKKFQGALHRVGRVIAGYNIY